jgi:hypothetical protein
MTPAFAKDVVPTPWRHSTPAGSRNKRQGRLLQAELQLADEASALASPPAKGLTAETAAEENGS